MRVGRRGDLLGLVRSAFFELEWGGLRPSHVRVLSLVPEGGCPVTELAALVGMTKQGCGQFVTTLLWPAATWPSRVRHPTGGCGW